MKGSEIIAHLVATPWRKLMKTYVPCPQCGTPDPAPVKFTWWGGMLGPKMLSHVKCNNCKATYNGKSGASNTTSIVIYSLAVFVIAFVVVIGFGVLTFLMK
jgi:hypothetical protein